jgi:glycosyltransferase involved in cell wall biosynthesis
MPDTVSPETLEGLALNLPKTLCHADHLITVSDATSNELIDRLDVHPRLVRTIHEGVDPGFADSGDEQLPEGVLEPYVLFVSTLEPRKNVVGILRAFGLLREWGYDGHLVLVGQWGWHTEAIRKEIETSPERPRILHLDSVDRHQLATLYRHADVLVFPSWIEGFGLPLVEAMACGTPVVTSGTSAMPEVAGPAAVYVDPASPHGIASAVASLRSDPLHRARLIELGRKRAQKFSWERAAQATASVLRQAAGLPENGPDEYRA